MLCDARLRLVALQRQLGRDVVVVAVRRLEHRDDHRDQQQDDPRAFERLRDRDDDQDDAGHHRAEAVDERAGLPPGLLRLPPVDHHARLRQGERDEDANHVERQQRLRVAAEHDDEDRREGREHQDAVREGEPVALVHELARQIAVARHDRGEPREVGVRRVRREDEDERRARLEQVVEDVRSAEDRPAQLRHSRLDAGSARPCTRAPAR